MTAFFFRDIPKYQSEKFNAVRHPIDNLKNILSLAEIINTCGHCISYEPVENFDVVIFSGNFCRALIKKKDGFFSMSLPFQIVDEGNQIRFNFDLLREEVSGQLISILMNAISSCEQGTHSHEEIIISICDSFGLDVASATRYCDAFYTLLVDDHGFFRFDDDQKNENGNIHPRYHFDFFFKNTSSVKIGIETPADINSFYSFFDQTKPKYYLHQK